MTKDLKGEKTSSELKSQISYITNNYDNSYKRSQATLSKHGIQKKHRNNKNIVMVESDKGNVVVILDINIYYIKFLELITDKTKVMMLYSDPTLSRKGKLQCYLRNLKKKHKFKI